MKTWNLVLAVLLLTCNGWFYNSHEAVYGNPKGSSFQHFAMPEGAFMFTTRYLISVVTMTNIRMKYISFWLLLYNVTITIIATILNKSLNQPYFVYKKCYIIIIFKDSWRSPWKLQEILDPWKPTSNNKMRICSIHIC